MSRKHISFSLAKIHNFLLFTSVFILHNQSWWICGLVLMITDQLITVKTKMIHSHLKYYWRFSVMFGHHSSEVWEHWVSELAHWSSLIPLVVCLSSPDTEVCSPLLPGLYRLEAGLRHLNLGSHPAGHLLHCHAFSASRCRVHFGLLPVCITHHLSSCPHASCLPTSVSLCVKTINCPCTQSSEAEGVQVSVLQLLVMPLLINACIILYSTS